MGPRKGELNRKMTAPASNRSDSSHPSAKSKSKGTLRSKLSRFMLLTLSLVCLINMLIVAAINYQTSQTNLKTIEGHIRDGIIKKGEVLLNDHALALRGLVVDNAYGGVDSLVRKTVNSDDEVVYGLFVSQEKIAWVYVFPGSKAGDTKALDAWRDLGIPQQSFSAERPFMRENRAFDQDLYEFSMQVADEEEILGVVVYGLSNERMLKALENARMQSRRALINAVLLVLLLTLLITAFGVFMARRIASKITRPLVDLTGAADAMASGERKATVDIRSGDELESLASAFNKMVQEVTEHRENLERLVTDRTTELEAAQGELVKASRIAGMAEIASNILHNVGNALNSVNVSSKLISEALADSAAGRLVKALELLGDVESDVIGFFQSHPKREMLAQYLLLSRREIQKEQDKILRLSVDLVDRVEHIKAIVSSQQTWARTDVQMSVIETCSVGGLVKEAQSVTQKNLEKSQAVFETHIEDDLQLVTDKHKLLAILVNLITNGAQALENADQSHRVVAVSGKKIDADRLQITVTDNGVGIPKQNLVKIFAHGFTTRAGGNGFGLHSCSLAAQELRGNITAMSDGEGKGAAFVLELPTKYRRISVF